MTDCPFERFNIESRSERVQSRFCAQRKARMSFSSRGHTLNSVFIWKLY